MEVERAEIRRSNEVKQDGQSEARYALKWERRMHQMRKEAEEEEGQDGLLGDERSKEEEKSGNEEQTKKADRTPGKMDQSVSFKSNLAKLRRIWPLVRMRYAGMSHMTISVRCSHKAGNPLKCSLDKRQGLARMMDFIDFIDFIFKEKMFCLCIVCIKCSFPSFKVETRTLFRKWALSFQLSCSVLKELSFASRDLWKTKLKNKKTKTPLLGLPFKKLFKIGLRVLKNVPLFLKFPFIRACFFPKRTLFSKLIFLFQIEPSFQNRISI